ncbi:MAG: restriction endonuclease subunit S, partial [Candidatus Competibacteraceae bacterium]|nr:restriction endonuclease subunit S [Candidatus Competibacteraceae bacterium]
PECSGIRTKGDFEKIRMIKPPIDLQNQFAEIVEKVEDIKSQYQQSLTELENLYGALSQKAFKGELALSRVPLEKISVQQQTAETDEQPATVPPQTTESDGSQTIQLPDPDDATALSSDEGRKAIIEQWLDAYIGQIRHGAAFSATGFIQAVQYKLLDIMDDAMPLLGVEEYDHIRDWVFQALEDGRLTQNYGDADKRVQINPVKV